MFNRREFSAAGLSGLAIAALQGIAVAEDRKGTGNDHHEAFDACTKACSACQRECDACATHCAHLLADGKKEHVPTLMSCHDCATICAAAARVVAGHGPFSATICESCATACAECAKMCEMHPDDKQMKACAAECRTCEKACREMLKSSGRKVL